MRDPIEFMLVVTPGFFSVVFAAMAYWTTTLSVFEGEFIPYLLWGGGSGLLGFISIMLFKAYFYDSMLQNKSSVSEAKQ